MTRIWYDTEFIEAGPTQPISPISIGMVVEGGPEYYAVFRDYVAIGRALSHPWLRDNVLGHLPITIGSNRTGSTYTENWHWDDKHPDYPAIKPREQIRSEVEQLIATAPSVQLRSWYAAYDHVVYAQLFGTMADLPEGFPMYTYDLKQECARLGNPTMPKQVMSHRSLEDARDHRFIDDFLSSVRQQRVSELTALVPTLAKSPEFHHLLAQLG